MVRADDSLVSWIVRVPDQSKIAGVIVQKPLVREASMVSVRLLERIREAALGA